MAVAIACVVSPHAAAQTAVPATLTVADVLQRTTAYVQDSIPATGYVPGARNTDTRQHRELNSDLLLVRPKGADRWVQFRDVFEVDGQPVHDRDQRLAKLFLSPGSGISDQAWQIADESARYNIGNLQRNINVPV